MDLESDCSVHESVEDNEEIANDSLSERLADRPKVQNNGSCIVENNDNNELFPELEQKGAEVSGHVNSPPVDLKPQMSPFPSSTKKGYGLRKWRRIKRDANRDGDSRIDTDKMVAQDLSISGANPSKRMQSAVRKQKSEGSVSSINALDGNLDGFTLLDDSGLGLGPPFGAGTDSENSEDQSSKSSTAASATKIRYETPAILGFPHDKSRTRSVAAKNLTHPMQRGQQGKGRTETTKKAKGERVKIEKENSHSSMESDSRSFNFVFMQGTYSINNGLQNEKPNDYDEENGDEVQGSGQQVTDGHHGGYGKGGEGEFEVLSPEERSEMHGSEREQDPLVEAIFTLQSAQDALEKEVLKFKEIVEDVSIEGSISDLCREFIDAEQKLQETSSEQLQDGEGMETFSRAFQSEVLETANRDVATRLEDLFKQKVETEVEYLVISRNVQTLKVAAVDQITVLEEQKVMASKQTKIFDKLGDAENKAAVLKKEAEKLDMFCEDYADKILKLQKRVCKYGSCFLLQLVLLLVILGIFICQSSPSYVEVFPT